jgi:hypothetical protein
MVTETNITQVVLTAGQTALVNLAGFTGGSCKTALTVKFGNNRSFVRFDQRAALEQAFAFGLTRAASGPSSPVPVSDRYMLIVGHTDLVGQPQPNEELSLRRARAVLAIFEFNLEEWEDIYRIERWNGENVEIWQMSMVADPPGTTSTPTQYAADRALRRGLFERYIKKLRPDWLEHEPTTVRPNLVTTPLQPILGCGLSHPLINRPGSIEENRRVEFFFFTSPTPRFTNCAHYPGRQLTCGQFISIDIGLRNECGAPYSGSFELTLPTGGALRNQQTDAQGRYTRDNVPPGDFTVEVEGWRASQTLSAPPGNVFSAQLLRPITRTGRSLRRGGQDFRFFGTSAYYLLEKAASGLAGSAADQRMIQDFFRIMSDCGVSVVRTWAYNDSQLEPRHARTQIGGPGAHPSLGHQGIDALDLVVDLARQNKIYLILALANYWHNYGGISQYARWSGYHTTHRQRPDPNDPTATHPEKGDPDHNVEELFYTGRLNNPPAGTRVVGDPRQLYLDYAIFIINRYRDRTNILAWELMNEPRVDALMEAPATRPARRRALQDSLRDWIGTTATTLRGHLPPQQPNQRAPFLSIGAGDMSIIVNDQGVNKRLLSFLFESPAVRNAIDLVDVHLYAEDFSFDVNQAQMNLERSMDVAQLCDKPFYLGEFGLPRGTTRHRAAEYSDWSRRLLDRDASGMLFWQLLPPNRPIYDPYEISVDAPPRPIPSFPCPLIAPATAPGRGQPGDVADILNFLNQQLTNVSTLMIPTWRIC